MRGQPRVELDHCAIFEAIEVNGLLEILSKAHKIRRGDPHRGAWLALNEIAKSRKRRSKILEAALGRRQAAEAILETLARYPALHHGQHSGAVPVGRRPGVACRCGRVAFRADELRLSG